MSETININYVCTINNNLLLYIYAKENLSKALKAPKKNGALIAEYLAKGASDKFQALAKKYNLDLEQFL